MYLFSFRQANRRARILAGLLSVFTVPLYAGEIHGSKHDLSHLDQRAGTGVMVGAAYDDLDSACIYCHTPHRPPGQQSRGNAPLWNREYPVSEYLAYQSPTLDASSAQPSGVSLACLSCHDGTLAVDRVLNRPPSPSTGNAPSAHMKIAFGGGRDQCSRCHRRGSEAIAGIHNLGIAAFGQNLSDDHPISIAYPRLSQDAQFQPRPKHDYFGNGVRLFNGRVECPSCHDVHNPDNAPFLRASVQGSDLCLTCHLK